MTLKALTDLPAPAKLNIFLRVVGRRADGYHLLQSLFVLVDWADTLHVELRGDARLHRHDQGPALPADDLSLRAARALQAASGCRSGADITVCKRVPWGAGLGGGSSDAATVLLALNRLWKLHWPRDRLATLALSLGADVPFFIGGCNAYAQGIGEHLTPVDWPARRYRVVKPPEGVSTAALFAHPELARKIKPATLQGSPAGTEHGLHQGPGQAPGPNDLQGVAERLCPAIAQVAQWLRGRYGNSCMTGSGSAVFSDLGPVPGPEAADGPPQGAGTESGTHADDLPAGWIGRTCRSLARHPLRDWAG